MSYPIYTDVFIQTSNEVFRFPSFYILTLEKCSALNQFFYHFNGYVYLSDSSHRLDAELYVRKWFQQINWLCLTRIGAVACRACPILFHIQQRRNHVVYPFVYHGLSECFLFFRKLRILVSTCFLKYHNLVVRRTKS